jgi:hypothetical protein
MSDTEDAATRSGILKAEFGVNWRNWRWLSTQFTPTSTAVLCAIVSVCGGWILHLSQRVGEQGVKIVVLEQQVVPYLEERKDESNNRVEIDNLKGRVKRLEDSYDTAQREAGTPPGAPQRGKVR